MIWGCIWILDLLPHPAHGLFEKMARLEVGLAAGRHVDSLAGAGISRGRLGLGVLGRECSKSPDFNPVPLNQLLAHHGEQSIRGLLSDVFVRSGALRDRGCQMLLGDGTQERASRGADALRSRSIPCPLACSSNRLCSSRSLSLRSFSFDGRFSI